MENLDLKMLKELSEADGIAGCEKEVSRIVKGYFEKYAEEITYDNLGSIIGLKKGKEGGPKVMIAGHMDEVGFLVRDIDDNGYINLLPVGGWWGHVMPAQEMTITTSKGDKIVGIVGSRAPHGMPIEEKSKVIKPMDLFIDLGISTRKEAEDLGIRIGDMITPNTEFKVMNNKDYLSGKAWDDRIGVAVAIDVLKNLQNVNHEANIYAVGTVQEEVGLRGARTAAQLINPDIAFAIDVTTAKDTPIDKGEIKLGCGVIANVLDATSMANRELLNKLDEISNELGIDINYEFMTVGGTDAGNIHKTFEGVVTVTMSIPTRYMHSPRLIIHRKDYIETVRVVSEFCKRLTSTLVNELKTSTR